MAEHIKVPIEIKFKSLKESLNDPVAENKPSLEILDYAKMGRSELLHVSLLGLF